MNKKRKIVINMLYVVCIGVFIHLINLTKSQYEYEYEYVNFTHHITTEHNTHICTLLMIEDSQVTRNNLIINNRTGRDVNSFPVIGNNNNGPF